MPSPTATRRALLAAPALLAAQRLGAQTLVEVFTADVRPYSIAEGERRGIALDVVRDAFARAGLVPRFTFLSFAGAIARTLATPGGLMCPIARTTAREASFAWVAGIVDVPQAIGTLRDRPAADLATARGLRRIGVVRGGLQGPFLASQGLTNLVEIETAAALAEALDRGEIDGWYATGSEILLQFERLGRPGRVHLGPPLQSAAVWLAANPDTASLPVAAIRDAVAGLGRDGGLDRIQARYLPRP